MLRQTKQGAPFVGNVGGSSRRFSFATRLKRLMLQALELISFQTHTPKSIILIKEVYSLFQFLMDVLFRVVASFH